VCVRVRALSAVTLSDTAVWIMYLHLALKYIIIPFVGFCVRHLAETNGTGM